MPADSWTNVSGCVPGKNSSAKRFISRSPMRMTAACEGVASQGQGRVDGGEGERAHLGVVAPLHAVDQASRNCDDVLEGAAERHADDVLRHGDAELLRLEQGLPLLGHVEVAAADRRLGERVLGDLVGNVRARQGGALDRELLADDLAEDVDLAVLDVDALDERDAVRALGDLALELLARLGDELWQEKVGDQLRLSRSSSSPPQRVRGWDAPGAG